MKDDNNEQISEVYSYYSPEDKIKLMNLNLLL